MFTKVACVQPISCESQIVALKDQHALLLEEYSEENAALKEQQDVALAAEVGDFYKDFVFFPGVIMAAVTNLPLGALGFSTTYLHLLGQDSFASSL
jgi:hypothetical protein